MDGPHPDKHPRRPAARLERQTGTLDAVLAASPDLVYLCDRAGTFLYANPAGARQWGRERDELLGMTWRDLGLPADLVARLARQRETVFESRRSLVDEIEFTTARGTVIWECLLTPIQDQGGGVEVVVVALRDVTDCRRAARALYESEEKYRLLAENSTDMISRHDWEGRFLYVSPACRRLVGFEPDELIGRSAYEFIHPDDVATVARTHATILQSPETLMVTFRTRRHDGRYIWFESTSHAIRDPETGAFVEIHCASRDVTARKEAEEALRESRALLQAILDHTMALIFVKDAQSRYILVNRRFQTVFKRPAESIIGKTVFDLFPTEIADVLRGNDRKVLEAGEPVAVEEVVEHDDGLHTYLSIKFPIPLAADGPPALGGISTDITDRKRVEEQLRLQNVRLEEVANSERQAHEALKQAESRLVQAEKLTALGQMVAGVAHEINNPLAFVTNNVAVLRRDVGALSTLLRLCLEAEDTLAAHRPDLLARIRETADRIDLPYVLETTDGLIDRTTEGLRRIHQIVRDLRDFARLDEGDLKEVDLNEGVVSTINIIRGRARTQGVAVEADLAPLPRVTCYPGKINQVVLNLLSNALDACPAGGKVTVRTRPDPDADGDGVAIQIIDSGQGIDPAIRDRIFDPFFTTKPVGKGTGLGLAISYGIVQAHGGRIDVASAPGQGADFTVHLPLASPGKGDGKLRELDL